MPSATSAAAPADAAPDVPPSRMVALEAQIEALREQLSVALDDISALKQSVATLSRRATKTYLFAACAALNSCNLGFDIGVSSAVGLEVQDNLGLTDGQAELFMGWINLCAIVGSLAASFLSDWMGRRRAFAVAAIGFEIGVLVMATARTYDVLMLGRSLVGLGVGFGLAVDPVYIAEIAPPGQRGRLVTWSEIATNIGINLGFICGAAFSGVDRSVGWRLMLGMGGVLPLVMLLLVKFVMPESPRWLIQKGREAEARDVLEMLAEPDLDAAVRRIQNALREESAANRSVGWRAIVCPGPALRRMLVVGVGVAVSQQLSGIDGIQYFLIYILKESGLESREQRFGWLVALGALKLACIFLAGHTFDRRGRKPMLYLSCAGMGVALALLSLNFVLVGGEGGAAAPPAPPRSDPTAMLLPAAPPAAPAVDAAPAPALAIVALAMYLAFFSFGMGPGAWLIPVSSTLRLIGYRRITDGAAPRRSPAANAVLLHFCLTVDRALPLLLRLIFTSSAPLPAPFLFWQSEVFSQKVRAKAMSVATFSNRIAATGLSLSFLSLANALGYAGVCLTL